MIDENSNAANRRNLRKFAVVMAGLAGVTFLLNAYGAREEKSVDSTQNASWNKTAADANAEGEVVVYIALPGIEKRITDGFAKKYPKIHITMNRQPTGALIAKLQAENAAKAPGADVAIMSDKRYYDDNINSLVPLRGDSAALYKDIPLRAEATNRVLPALILPFGIATNPDRVKQLGARPIESYGDLLQPQLKGSIGLTRADITPVSLQWFYVLDRSLGADFLPRLAALDPRLYPSTNPIMQAVAAGDLAAGLYAQPAAAGSLKDRGAPLVDIYPDPQFAYIYFVAITGWATHPAAAQVFVNWLTSVEGQTELHAWGRTGSALPTVKAGFQVKSTESVFDGILTAEQEKFEKKWNKIFLKQ